MITNKNNAVNQLRASMPEVTFLACEHLEQAKKGFPEPHRTFSLGLNTTLLLCQHCSGFIFETIVKELLNIKIKM